MKQYQDLKKMNGNSQSPLIAILRGVKPSEVLAIAQACEKAGISTLEVTLNSPMPYESIRRLARHYSKNNQSSMLVGAGTVTTESEVTACREAGARFIVSPNCNPKIIALTKRLGLLSYPGVFTPSEAYQAIEAGADGLKLFPAFLHGKNGVKAFREVLPVHTPLYAVGGVDETQFAQYMKVLCYGFGLGSSLYKAGNTAQQVETKAKNAVEKYCSLVYRNLEIDTVNESRCSLGEGPCWDAESQNLYFVDINKKTLYLQAFDDRSKVEKHTFQQMISSMAVIDKQQLLLAGESGLLKYNLQTRKSQLLIAVEADESRTRANDGRTDRHGAFWFGTMGKHAEPKAGAIYRYSGDTHQLKKVFSGITIPNSISFSPQGDLLYYADTPERIIYKVPLGSHGLPIAKPSAFIKIADASPDGSVVDANAELWNAQWGASRVVRYSRDGFVAQVVALPALQPTCPAFVGNSLKRMVVTSALQGLEGKSDQVMGQAGNVFSFKLDTAGIKDNLFIV